MIHSHLDKAFALARRTGDKIIVVDRYDESAACVVMSIDEYERLLGEDRDGHWDDGDDWKKDHLRGMTEYEDDENDEEYDDEDEINDDNFADFSQENGLFDDIPPFDGDELDKRDEYGTISDTFNDWQKQKNRWEIASEVKQAGAAAPQPSAGSAGVEDERYYLEAI